MKKYFKKIGLCFTILFVFSTVIPHALPINIAEAANIKLNKTELTMVIGTTYQLKVSGASSKIGWSSNKKTIATVSSGGRVTAKKNGKASITAMVGKKKYTCEVSVTVLNTVKKIEEYIYERYATLKTDLGTFRLLEKDDDFGVLCLQVEQNEKVSHPYDYRILIRWEAMHDDGSVVQWQYNDILESIKYTDKQKNKFKKAFLNYQKKMALDLMNVLPDKKILGGFVTDGYKYPYSKVGWYEDLYMSWRNYDSTDYEYGNYYESTVADFQWND